MDNVQGMTQEQLLARIAQLEKQVKNNAAKGTGLRVSEKGGVSFYGTGRFPVSLYASQWATLLAKADEIRQFILDNVDSLSFKDEEQKLAVIGNL